MGPEPVGELRWERARRELIEAVRDTGIEDLEVLRAIDQVPRHIFLPAAVHPRAYQDAPLPIGFGQTASQPSLQALYLQTLKLQPRDKVLEIGTGSGYQTALLAQLAANVYSIERVRELSVRARAALDQLRIANVALLVGDGTIGWSKYAPYDAILVTAAAPAPPPALLEQLTPAGRMLIPIGGRELQTLRLYRRTAEGFEHENIVPCAFVPLLGRFGWPS